MDRGVKGENGMTEQEAISAIKEYSQKLSDAITTVDNRTENDTLTDEDKGVVAFVVTHPEIKTAIQDITLMTGLTMLANAAAGNRTVKPLVTGLESAVSLGFMLGLAFTPHIEGLREVVNEYDKAARMKEKAANEPATQGAG